MKNVIPPADPRFQQALTWHRAGRWAEAEHGYRALLAAQPRHPQALHFLGLLLTQTARPQEALAWLEKARKADPVDPVICLDLGNAHDALGDAASAERCYRQAIALRPDFPGGHFNLGALYARQGRHADAIAAYRGALEAAPQLADAWINLGNAHKALQEFEAAEAAYRRACELQPQRVEPCVNLGSVLLERGADAEAHDRFQAALALDPGNAYAHHHLGLMHEKAGRAQQAADHYAQALAAAPDLVETRFRLAALLHNAKRFEAAVEHYRAILAAEPDHLDAKLNLASALTGCARFAESEALFGEVFAACEPTAQMRVRYAACLAGQGRYDEACAQVAHCLALGAGSTATLLTAAEVLLVARRHDEAEAVLRRAEELDPGSAAVRGALGRLEYERGRWLRARAHYEATLALDPAHERARFDLALIGLLLGEWPAAWAGYHSMCRKSLSVLSGATLTSDTRLPADVRGKTVLLKQEQGIGDELFFLRFVPALKQRGARVHFRASAKTAQLLKHAPGAIDRLCVQGDAAPDADHALFLSALPDSVAALEATPLRTPRPAPDARRRRWPRPLVCRVFWPPPPPPWPLRVDPARLPAARAALAAAGPAPYVGVTWRAGSVKNAPLAREGLGLLSKEIPPRELGARLRGLAATPVVLQRNPDPEELAQFAAGLGRTAADVSGFNDDLEDMLALLALLDDYVGVSNTNMHLAAGIGKTARVLVPFPPEWRWTAWGDSSPWFPGFRIYRQRRDRDWGQALNALERDLAARFGRAGT